MSKQDVITDWVHCPVCGNKTRLQIRQDTARYRINKLSSLLPEVQTGKIIDAKDLQITVIKKQ